MGQSWCVRVLGEPSTALTREEIGAPEVRPGEVAVRVRAASVNFPDLLLCRGEYHHKPALPFALGSEAAGEIVASGQGAGFPVGAHVLVAPMTYGCFSEHVVAPAGSVFEIPPTMPWEDAACIFLTYQTAWIGLHRRAGIKPGDWALVLGASGGVGSAAVQVAQGAGAKVLATVSSPAKARACEEMGSHQVVDLSSADLREAVMTATRGRGVDIVVDPVGGELFEQASRLLTVEGRYLVMGFASGTIPAARLNHPLMKNYSIVGFRLQPFREDVAYTRRVHAALLALHQAGVVAPVVRERYPFDSVPQAVARLGKRTAIGKIVILGS